MVYEQALAADPDLQEAWLGLAGLTPDPMFARALYERILQKWPDCELARMALDELNAEGAPRMVDDADDQAVDPLDAAARAGAPLYRGAYKHDRASAGPVGGGTPGPRLTARWPYLLCVLVAIAILVTTIALWQPWRRALSGERAVPVVETARGAPPDAPAPDRGGDPASRLHPLARRHLAFLPATRSLELDLAEGTLQAYEQGQMRRTIPVQAPRELAAGTIACRGGASSEAWISAPGHARPLAGCAPEAAWLYALDLTPEDADWLSGWLGPQGISSGRIFVGGERIWITLDQALQPGSMER